MKLTNFWLEWPKKKKKKEHSNSKESMKDVIITDLSEVKEVIIKHYAQFNKVDKLNEMEKLLGRHNTESNSRRNWKSEHL